MWYFSKLKAQSAIEYLMTYGWMLLVVAIVGGAVFSVVGGQGVESVSGFDSQDVVVQDFGVSQENGLMFSMNDPIGQTTVTEVTVSGSDTSNVTYILNQDVSEQNIVNLPGVVTDESDNGLEVEIEYNSGTLENLTTSGTITGSLKIDENFHNQEIILDGLAGYWPLSERYSDENTVYDMTTNNNHGLKNNNLEFVEGITGDQALEFDGEEDYVEAIPAPALKDEGAVSVWFKSLDNNNRNHVFLMSVDFEDVSAGWSSSSRGNFLFATDEGALHARLPRHEADGGTKSMKVRDIDQNEAYHAVITWDDDVAKVYVDGVFENQASDDDYAWTDVEEKMRIGAPSDWGRVWNGKIDDFRVYDRTLSESEIQALNHSSNLIQ